MQKKRNFSWVEFKQHFLRQAKPIHSWSSAPAQTPSHTHRSAHSNTHVDLLTSGVPLALLSEQQLELGDNLIDFIFLVWLSARPEEDTSAAQHPPWVLTFPSSLSSLQHRCRRAVSGLLLIDVSACFMSFWRYDGPDMVLISISLSHTTESDSWGKARRTHTKKEEENLWGCHWLRSAPASSLTEASPPF